TAGVGRTAGGQLVLLPEGHRLARPERLVAAGLGEPGTHREGEEVPRRTLLFAEADGLERHRRHRAGQHGVGPGRLGHDAVAAAADELVAQLLRQHVLDLEVWRAVLERRYADRANALRQVTA